MEKSEKGGLPGVDILSRRENRLACFTFSLEKAFQLEEFLTQNFVFQLGEPCLVQTVDFEREEIFLLLGEFLDPGFFVEFLGGGGCA